jgi:hypothetical protein
VSVRLRVQGLESSVYKEIQMEKLINSKYIKYSPLEGHKFSKNYLVQGYTIRGLSWKLLDNNAPQIIGSVS